jgi:hypothetical protein
LANDGVLDPARPLCVRLRRRVFSSNILARARRCAALLGSHHDKEPSWERAGLLALRFGPSNDARVVLHELCKVRRQSP